MVVFIMIHAIAVDERTAGEIFRRTVIKQQCRSIYSRYSQPAIPAKLMHP